MNSNQSVISLESNSTKIIDLVRLPLTLMVIFIHIQGYGQLGIHLETYPLYRGIIKIFSSELPSMAVPAFFLISGYLFFRNQVFNKRVYISKLKSRSHSLLQPYLFWNGFLVLLIAIAMVFPALKSISLFDQTLTVKSAVSSFRNYNQSTWPIVVQLWYVRDLMITCILSPLIYWLIKYTKGAGIALLLILWLFDIPQSWLNAIPYTLSAFVLFTLGAWAGFNARDLVQEIYRFRIFGWMYPILLAVDFMDVVAIDTFIHHLGILSGICLVFYFCTLIVEKGKISVPHEYRNVSYWVYLIHNPWMVIICGKFCEIILPAHSLMSVVIGYFLCGYLIMSVSVMVYFILKKYAPVLLKIAMGTK